jgi:uncharacterized protein YbcC (UPF0753/DUF2309 family)
MEPVTNSALYTEWKLLASLEWSPCAIAQSGRTLGRQPANPEDALLEHLAVLGIPPEAWQDHLPLHFSAMPGWAGFRPGRVG